MTGPVDRRRIVAGLSGAAVLTVLFGLCQAAASAPQEKNAAGTAPAAGVAKPAPDAPKPAPVVRHRLQIINGTTGTVEVFRLKAPDQRVPEGSVAAGKHKIFNATPGERFVAVGADKTESVVTCEVPVQAFRVGGIPAFYTQKVEAGGFPIVASAAVNPYALKEAAYIFDKMLAKRPDVRAAMVKSGARLCILGVGEFTCDQPEWAWLAEIPERGFENIPARDYRDARARGMGGSLTDPYCSCAEENLLAYDGDPYAAENILIHELAHNIHLRGMSNVDPGFDGRVRAAWDAAMKEGLWKGKYASVNHHEYFAEGVQSWFDDNRENDHDHNHVNTRKELIEYDPRLAELCREVFGDTEFRYTKPQTRLKDHLAGYDPAKAPKFEWPKRLQDIKAAIRKKAAERGTAPKKDETKKGANPPGGGEPKKADPAGLDTKKAEPVPAPKAAPAAAVRKLPNIVFILADDLGYGDVRCYNDKAKVPTPNIDRLAGEGMRFTDAHSPSTVCTPTRYGLMTGQMPFRVPRGSMVFTGAGGPTLIAADRLTLPAMLRGRGYSTCAVGKWHLGLTFRDAGGKPVHDGGRDAARRIDFSRRVEGGPLDCGFDRFFGTACCPTTDWLYCFIDGDRIPVPPAGPLDRSKLPDHPYSKDCRPGFIAPDFPMEEVDMVFLRKSREFLADHARNSPGKPFFLFHATQAVHLPSLAAKEFQGRTGAGPHGDFIAQLDHVVGVLTDDLRKLGLADDTVIIFTSDNGPEVASAVNMRRDHGHDGARPWRGIKRDGWEGGHRVPFIVRAPGIVKAGAVSDQTVCLTDVMATLASMTGAVLPENSAEDSFDLSSVLAGSAAGPVRPWLLTQAFAGGRTLSVRRGNWKYMDHRGSGGNGYATPELTPYMLPDTAPDAAAQLYDLSTDPGETTNLVLKHPTVAAELKALLEQTRKSGRSRP